MLLGRPVMDLVSPATAAVTAGCVVITAWLRARYADKMHARACELARDLARPIADEPADGASTPPSG